MRPGQGRAAGKVGAPGSEEAWLVGGKAASGSGGDARGEGGDSLLQKTLSLPLWGVRDPCLPGEHLRRVSRWQGGSPPPPIFPTSRQWPPQNTNLLPVELWCKPEPRSRTPTPGAASPRPCPPGAVLTFPFPAAPLPFALWPRAGPSAPIGHTLSSAVRPRQRAWRGEEG